MCALAPGERDLLLETTDNNSTPKKVKPLPDWSAPFLAALRNSANVRASCQAAHIDRKTAYNLRNRSKAFALDWDDAMEDACDVLEAEARNRAMHISDLLLIFLLKAHRPEKFRETIRQEVTGAGGGAVAVKVIEIVKDYGPAS